MMIGELGIAKNADEALGIYCDAASGPMPGGTEENLWPVWTVSGSIFEAGTSRKRSTSSTPLRC